MSTLTTKLRRDLAAQWPQFLAITVTIVLGVASYAATADAFRNLSASYDNLHVQLDNADLWITGGDTSAIAMAAGAIDEVDAVTTRVQADLPLRMGGVDKLRGRIIGVPAGSQPDVARLLAVDGGATVDGDRALAERHLADHFDLQVGTTVEVLGSGAREWTGLEVAGVVESAEYIWPARSRQEVITLPDDFGVLFVPDDVAERLAGTSANQVLVTVEPGTDDTVLADLEAQALAAGATEVLTRPEQPSNAALQEDIDGFSEMAVAFPLLFLTAAGMAAYVLLTRRVQSERSVIGMLLASGMHRAQIVRHYLGFGLVVGTAGAVVGVLAGLAGARTMTRLYLGFIGLPDQVAVFDLRVTTIAGGLAFGVLAGAVSALAPALLASRVAPAEAMRAVVQVTGGRRSLFERVLPSLRRLPVRWRLVLRSIGRNRRRTAYTVVGVTLSLLLILSTWSMLDTMDALLATQFDVVQQQDARVDFAGPVGDDALARVAGIDGVAAVEPATMVPASLDGPDGQYGTVLVALPSGTTMHGFLLEDGSTTDLPDDGVLVGRGARSLTGIEAGDSATLAVPDAGIEQQVTVVDWLDEPLGTFAYVSRDRAEAWTGGALPATSALLRLEDGADRDAVRRAVEDLEVVGAYEDSQALVALYDRYVGLFYGVIGLMLVLGGTMAFAIMFTTMSVNVLERFREVATLRASGVRASQVSRMLMAENLLMTLLGIVPGLVAGVVGGRLLMDSYSSDLFRLDLVVRPWTLVGSAAAILVVALVSQVPSLRAIRRLDLAAAVRRREA